MSTIGPITAKTTGYTPFINGGSYRSSDSVQEKYRGKPRQFVAPLPYYRRLARSKVLQAGPGARVASTQSDCLNYGARVVLLRQTGGMVARCKQQAYSKLVDQIKTDSMGWGENLATRKQSFEMMLHRIGTLTNAARRLKRGDIPGFCRALGVTQKPSRSRLKNLSSTWLEYHFGWEPLYGDIYTLCRTLSSDVPAHTIRASSAEEASFVTSPTRESNQIAQARVIVKYQGTYYVDNPNKFLLNKMGVINPVSVAWELVPFSFAVDWFIPIGQYLQSFSDFWGVGRRDEFTTVYQTASAVAFGKKSLPERYQFLTKTDAVDVRRTLGIDVPKPTFKLFKGFSLVRGATAIALLIGMLRSLG